MSSSRLRTWLFLGGLLLVTGAKLGLIRSFGSDVPLADQWTAEGSTLFQPYVRDGRVPPDHFFFSHGEHRPVMTRFIAYACFRLNGDQWDARVECVANLAVQAVTFALLWFLAGQLAEGRILAVLRGVTVTLCALPSIQENYVWGFQSQFLLLVCCGLAHVAGTMLAPAPGRRWWLAQAAGLAGILSLSSGFLSAVALAALALWDWTVRGRRDRWVGHTLIANLVLTGFGWWFLTPIVDSADHVRTPGQFAAAFFSLLNWPSPWRGWGLLSQVPVWALMAVRWARGSADLARNRVVTGLLLWLYLLVAAIAFGRGGAAAGVLVANRYMDVLVVGCWLNLLAVLALAGELPGGGWRRAVGLCLLPAWLGLAAANAPGRLESVAQTERDYRMRHDATVREFRRTDDPAVFERDPAVRQAFPHLPFTIELLRDRRMDPVWPASLQPERRAGPLSWLALRMVRAGGWLVAVGTALLLAAGALPFRRALRNLNSMPSASSPRP